MLGDKNLSNFPPPSATNISSNDTWLDLNHMTTFNSTPGSLITMTGHNASPTSQFSRSANLVHPHNFNLDSIGTGGTNFVNPSNNSRNDDDISLVAQRQQQMLAEAKRSVRGLDPRIPLRLENVAKPRPYNGPRAEVVLAMRQQHLSQGQYHFYDKPLMLVEGQMQYVFNETGQAFLDMYSNVCHVGFSHPQHVRAISQAAGEILSNTRYLHPNIVEYTRRLKEKFPPHLSVVYLVNSGSEANDLAMRLARCHTKRKKMACLSGAYHGTTLSCSGVSTSISVGTEAGATDYEYAAQDTVVIPAADCYRGRFKGSDPEAAEKYIQWSKEIIEESCGEQNIAGFIVEAIQGVAGQIIYPNGYLAKMCEYINSIGGVTIVDEVQTGFGRVGSHFWAFEAQGAKPDIVTLGKPMGNGFPIGAVLTTREISRSFDDTKYFNTFGGNPLSCAAGLAVLDIIERDNLQQLALKVGVHLIRGLQELQRRYEIIGDVRGAGTFVGIELVRNRDTLEPAADEAKHIMEELKKYGILVGKGGIHNNVIRMKPPMCVTKENVDLCLQIFEKVLENLPRTFEEERARQKGAAKTGKFPRNSYVFPGSKDSITNISDSHNYDDFEARYSQTGNQVGTSAMKRNNNNNDTFFSSAASSSSSSNNSNFRGNDAPRTERLFNFQHQRQNNDTYYNSEANGRPSLRDAVARSLARTDDVTTTTTTNSNNNNERFGYNWHSGNRHNPQEQESQQQQGNGGITFPSAPTPSSVSRNNNNLLSTTRSVGATSLRDAVRRSLHHDDQQQQGFVPRSAMKQQQNGDFNQNGLVVSPKSRVSFASNNKQESGARRGRDGEYNEILRNSTNGFALPH